MRGSISRAAGLALALVLAPLAAAGSFAGMDLDLSAMGYGVMARAESNLMSYDGALGGAEPDPVTATGDPERPFATDGNTFTTFQEAAERSCSNQKNECARIANSGEGGDTTVGDCDQQQSECMKAASAGPAATTSSPATDPEPSSVATATATLQSEDSEFYYFCDP